MPKTKDLEILERQRIALYIANKDNIMAIRNQKQDMELTLMDIFNLGVMVGKREERNRKHHTAVSRPTEENIYKNCIKDLLEDIKRPKALGLVCRYLQSVWVEEQH